MNHKELRDNLKNLDVNPRFVWNNITIDNNAAVVLKNDEGIPENYIGLDIPDDGSEQEFHHVKYENFIKNKFCNLCVNCREEVIFMFGLICPNCYKSQLDWNGKDAE